MLAGRLGSGRPDRGARLERVRLDSGGRLTEGRKMRPFQDRTRNPAPQGRRGFYLRIPGIRKLRKRPVGCVSATPSGHHTGIGQPWQDLPDQAMDIKPNSAVAC